MNPSRRRRIAAALAFALAAAVALSGCRPSANDRVIDGVLWRQVASFEDPLSRQLYDPLGQDPLANDPATYLAVLGGARWDGTDSSAEDLSLGRGGVVLYDLSSTMSVAELSVFVASGPRADVPTDDGRPYFGPSAVFTCYGVRAEFGAELAVQQTDFDECPAALVARLPGDATFVVGRAFDG